MKKFAVVAIAALLVVACGKKEEAPVVDVAPVVEVAPAVEVAPVAEAPAVDAAAEAAVEAAPAQ